ncbi:MAG: hypothetical protein WC515_08940 [Candidatus Omnitrophota bacterium]
MMANYNKRQEAILEIIVKHYVETAEPVGSRFVARRLGLSSATIRNAMADLEDGGFIMQPYTSAGRIPTDKGYRFYIDSLMRVRNVNEQVVKTVDEQYHHAIRSLEDALEKTSYLISDLTNYVGITLFPKNEKVYLEGASHIIEQPEFRDLRKLYALLKCLEAKREMLNLLVEDIDDDRLTIHIGKENKLNDLKECSIVTRGYKVRGKMAGRVGVIGPKRMVYEKVIPTIEFLATTLSDILEEFEV